MAEPAEHDIWKDPSGSGPGFEFKPRHYYHPAKPLDHFAREISAALRSRGKPLSELEIFMEPGRWLSSPAMHVLIKVTDKKKQPCDCGRRDQPARVGTASLRVHPPSQSHAPFPARVPREDLRQPVHALDIWGTSLFGEGVENGDVLLVPDQGSYTYCLRQSFIKPIARVVRFDGTTLSEAKPEEIF